jgi:hypothetical protein
MRKLNEKIVDFRAFELKEITFGKLRRKSFQKYKYRKHPWIIIFKRRACELDVHGKENYSSKAYF